MRQEQDCDVGFHYLKVHLGQTAEVQGLATNAVWSMRNAWSRYASRNTPMGGGRTKGDSKCQSGREGSVRRHICERVRGDVRRDSG